MAFSLFSKNKKALLDRCRDLQEPVGFQFHVVIHHDDPLAAACADSRSSQHLVRRQERCPGDLDPLDVESGEPQRRRDAEPDIDGHVDARRVERQRAARLARREAKRTGQVLAAPEPVGLRSAPSWLRAGAGLAYVYVALMLTLVWVAVPDLSSGVEAYRWIFSFRGGLDLEALAVLVYGAAVLVLTDRRQRVLIQREGSWDPPTTVRAVAYGAMATAVLVFAGSASEPFIYFQF